MTSVKHTNTYHMHSSIKSNTITTTVATGTLLQHYFYSTNSVLTPLLQLQQVYGPHLGWYLLQSGIKDMAEGNIILLNVSIILYQLWSTTFGFLTSIAPSYEITFTSTVNGNQIQYSNETIVKVISALCFRALHITRCYFSAGFLTKFFKYCNEHSINIAWTALWLLTPCVLTSCTNKMWRYNS